MRVLSILHPEPYGGDNEYLRDFLCGSGYNIFKIIRALRGEHECSGDWVSLFDLILKKSEALTERCRVEEPRIKNKEDKTVVGTMRSSIS